MHDGGSWIMTTIYVIVHDDPHPEDRSVEFFASTIDSAKKLVKHKIENGWSELSIYTAELDVDDYWLDRNRHFVATGTMENGKFTWNVRTDEARGGFKIVDDF
jgi:hypothetical protein